MTLQQIRDSVAPATLDVRLIGREFLVEIQAPPGESFRDGTTVHRLRWGMPCAISDVLTAALIEHRMREEGE